MHEIILKWKIGVAKCKRNFHEFLRRLTCDTPMISGIFKMLLLSRCNNKIKISMYGHFELKNSNPIPFEQMKFGCLNNNNEKYSNCIYSPLPFQNTHRIVVKETSEISVIFLLPNIQRHIR